MNNRIELLSPAKNCEIGIEAINHGADAVYIGPPKFGARASASNSFEDIEKLVSYAHLFNAKVYVTLNTIFKDSELDEVRKLIFNLYNIGVDALIIQDMSILEMDIPPIHLHASTQCDIRTLEKVQFLEKCGFQQVVLARETPIDTMKYIADNTNVTLEAFIHGALCVSYSGRCYLSQYQCGRSANRGVCAQLCRVKYNLVDADNREIIKNKHLLSLKDLNASSCLKEMIDAGISSFKIEGRLKDLDYVKTITAHYRLLIDNILNDKDLKKSSSGYTKLLFNPDIEKTFYRGSTTYFLKQREKNLSSFDTPKSLGKYVGKVSKISDSWFSIDKNDVDFANGDGICFINKNGDFEGVRINKVEGGKLFPLSMPNFKIGTSIFKNFDANYNKLLSHHSADRIIPIEIIINKVSTGFSFYTIDCDNISSKIEVTCDVELAKNSESMEKIWREQFSKLGNTCFELKNISFSFKEMYFIPSSLLTQWKKSIVENHVLTRINNYKREEFVLHPTNHKYNTEGQIDYSLNVNNLLSKRFYERHGITNVPMAFESNPLIVDDVELMRTKYCIKYALGYCSKQHNKIDFKDPLYITNGKDKYRLIFDCKNCEMIIKKDNHSSI